MSIHKSGMGHWVEIKQTLGAKIAEWDDMLKIAYTNAKQTFSDRLKKVESEAVRSKLTACQETIETNYNKADALRQFCEKLIATNDTAFRKCY